MAKIIERRDAHVRKPTHHKCRRCMSLIEFSTADIRSDQRDGDYVVCPVCNSFIASSLLWETEMT